MINNINKQSKIVGPTLFSDDNQASVYTAKQIADLIREKQDKGQHAVIGLATGNTPKQVYKELIRLHKNEGLSFQNVISFNLDEYYPIGSDHNLSYSFFMRDNLFNHVDMNPENINVPHTDHSSDKVVEYCKAYENKIVAAGGLDLQLLGIGRNGHIGFNEPGSDFSSNTRLVDLHPLTRSDAASDFGSLDKVPHQAISIGIDTILKAKRILLLALGERKSEIMNKALFGEVSSEVPASVLQTVPHVEYVLDHEAAMLIRE